MPRGATVAAIYNKDVDWNWTSEAKCKGVDLSLFFEVYERADDVLRKKILRTCVGCPVIAECAEFAVRAKQTGVHAGAYYAAGKRKPASFREEMEE